MSKNSLSDRCEAMLPGLKLPEDLRYLDYGQCKRLCREIRSLLVNTVSKTGGHLASNLGVVELTLALHRVFDSPADKIVWDVGHQSYTHKILTGRLERFSTLRQENGLSGFPKPSESEHDAFISGHSSTSISIACGFAEAMRMNHNTENYAVAVIGDGAFSGGLAYEALNNVGKQPVNLIVIINHNDMSISKNVGAFARYLCSIRGRESYVKTKFAVENKLNNTPLVGRPIRNAISASKSAFKRVINQQTMFEELGFVYLGPVDGHDIPSLEDTLYAAKTYKRPVVIHVNTVKGKGYPPAENNPGEFHGISSFDVMTGNPEVSANDSFSAEFGHELVRLAADDEKICAITAAMKYGTGLQFFYKTFKERFFDVGIAEEHSVTFAAALAKSGFLPVFAVYSTFLQRAYDQLLHDAALSGVHMLVAIDRAGIVGEDGETHQGIFDVAMLSSIPETRVYSPSNYAELKLCLSQALHKDKGLVALRYPRGTETEKPAHDFDSTGFFCRSVGSRCLVITYGRIFETACEVVDNDADLMKLTLICPIPKAAVDIAGTYSSVLFFEEGIRSGGVAEHFLGALNASGYKGSFKSVAIDGFVRQATVASSLHTLELDAEGMRKHIRSVLLPDEA